MPVVLVHGLWGDLTSLQSTQSFLDTQFPFSGIPAFSGISPYFVTPICYSTYLAYYATSDTLPNAGTGCEQTSTKALANYLSSLYANLDASGIVGGRVDIVAHSMGGLVARNFSNFGAYRNARNRNQGTFRDVITLDTPETGSALTYFLDYVFATHPLSPSATSSSTRLWNSLCLSFSFSQTVEECMAAFPMRNPLAFPGHDLKEGAVYSLIPDDYISLLPPSERTGLRFSDLPTPNIPNATWFAVGSTFPDNGQLPTATVRDFLSLFISATYPSNEAPETLTDMLGNGPNDVVVTLGSQLDHVIPGQAQTFNYLSHTRVPTAVVPFFPHSLNDTVTASPAVNQQIANWLGYGSYGASPQIANTMVQTANPLSPSFQPRASGILDGKIAGQPDDLTQPVDLAQPVQIQLNLPDENVVSITVLQHNGDKHLQNQSAGVALGSGEAKIVRDDGLTKTIEVVPLQVGTLGLDILTIFADGGMSRKSYLLHVVPSSKGLKKFYLNHGSKALPVVLEDNDEDRQSWLAPEVFYDQLDYPIYLADSSQIKFTVDQSEGDPVIRLDSNGMVHGLRPGRAKITANFDGKLDDVVVNVYAKDAVPAGYRTVHNDSGP